MSTMDAEAERIYDKLGRGEQTDVKTIRAALLAAEKRGKEEAAKNASDYAEGIADQFDRLAADGGRKSKWNAILAENFHSIAAAIRGS